MKHLEPINRKAERIEAHIEGAGSPGVVPYAEAAPGIARAIAAGADASGSPTTDERDVVALQDGSGVHIPLGCSLVFSPGWEADSSGGTAGLCQPVERDLFDCHLSCFWPAHVPDQLNHSPDWTARCAAAQKDWRNIDLIFP
jgi:hypothetical protein